MSARWSHLHPDGRMPQVLDACLAIGDAGTSGPEPSAGPIVHGSIRVQCSEPQGCQLTTSNRSPNLQRDAWMARPRHPKADVEDALRHAEDRGWRDKRSR
jgi:hypothetical protein